MIDFHMKPNVDLGDEDKGLSFDAFGEIVNSDYGIVHLSSSYRK